MAAVIELSNHVGTRSACASLGIPRASYYRDLAPQSMVHARHAPSLPGHSAPKSAKRSSAIFTASASGIIRPCRLRPHYSTKVITIALRAPCTVCSPPPANPVSAAINSPIPLTPSMSCWPQVPTNSGVGTSPSCLGQPSGPTSTFMSYSMFSADTPSDG